MGVLYPYTVFFEKSTKKSTIYGEINKIKSTIWWIYLTPLNSR